MHHLPLGPGPSTHVTCHCHLMLTTENHPQILQTSSTHGQCMYGDTHTPGMHSKHTEELTISYSEKKSLSSPEILQEGRKVPHGKSKFFQFYHPRASYITASNIRVLFWFSIFFSLQEIGRSSMCVILMQNRNKAFSSDKTKWVSKHMRCISWSTDPQQTQPEISSQTLLFGLFFISKLNSAKKQTQTVDFNCLCSSVIRQVLGRGLADSPAPQGKNTAQR